jgi:hypothetical protein
VRTKLALRSSVDLLIVQLSNLSAFEEAAMVQGPTVMTSSSACATADVAKNMMKESAADVRMATPLGNCRIDGVGSDQIKPLATG